MSASTQLEGGVTGDAELISSARSGDAAAIGALYERHAGAAWVVARQYSDSPEDADDVVADSFAAVFGAIERGNGPESAFRAYLFTVVRRVAGLRREKNRRVQPTDDVAVLEAGTALAGTAEDPALAGFERGVVARAFHSLPERWQAVLWHTEVEGLTPAEIAPILGLTANGVAALAYRAREGLRQAYLQQHLQDPLDEGCRSVAGKLGAYVRGGLGSRETAQVEAHLEDCGTCRGLLLELGDVNHGMRAVIAPLVLGLLGLGALGAALPVGGGLAAGAAAAAATGAGGAGAGASGVAAGGTTAAGAAATGTVTAVGAGAAGGAAAAGGVAAFLAAIPLGAAAVVVGGLALAAVAAVAIVNLLGSPDDATLAEPEPTVSESPSASPQPSSSAAVAAPQPTDIPTPEPSDLPTDDVVLDDDEDDVAGDVTADGPTDTATTPTTTTNPTTETTPGSPTDPVVPPVPPAPAPASVAVDVPPGGLTLEAGLGGQELVVGLLNSGGTAATDLVAEVTLPDGVALDGVSAAAIDGLAAGRFAVMGAAGWICVDGAGAGTTVARCTLDRLPALSTSTLVLRVSIDESFDKADGEIGLRVMGAGIDYVAPPIRVAIAPAPARLALRTTPTGLPLVNGRTRHLDLPVANMGGAGLPAGAGVVSVHLPAGVTGATVAGSTWSCTGASPLLCRSGAVAARADAPLSLLLSAAPTGVPTTGLLAVEMAPSGRNASETVTVPFTVQRPAALAISGPDAATVAVGSPATVPLQVSNTGDLPAQGVTVTLSRPAGVDFGSPVVSSGAWDCSAGSTTVECATGVIDAGATLDLPVGLQALTGSFGSIGTVTVSAQAPDADPAAAFGIAVDALAPVLSLDPGDPLVLLSAAGTGTASFTLRASAADAESTRATLRLPINLRADLETAASPPNACTASADLRSVTCELQTVTAGSTVQVLVGVRSAGSARGTASVAVEAVGAKAQSQSTVQTSSAGLDVRDSFTAADVTEIGAPLLSCSPTVTICASAIQKGDRDNNSLAMVPLDEAKPAPTAPRSSVPVSSTARLTVPAGREILFAGLYWSANAAAKDTWSAPLTAARLRAPGGAFTEVTGQTLVQPTDNANRRYYQSFADVTALVAAGGAGDWSVADIAVSATSTDPDRTYYAGWSLVVVFSDPASDASVTVYDGGQWIGSAGLPIAFEFAADAGTLARIGVVAWEGDRNGTGDSLVLGDTCLGTSAAPVQRALVPTRLGGYDGSASNAFDSTATGWRATNSLGTDAKGFRPVRLACDVSSLTAQTAGDQFLIGAITLRSEPVPEVESPPQG